MTSEITLHDTTETKLHTLTLAARLEAGPLKMLIVCMFVVVIVTVLLNVLVCCKCSSFYPKCSFQPSLLF